jgi:class 3 adenylate cyclase
VDIHRTLNRYFAEMAEIVFAHEGTIDKYIGDGLMVFFGDPTPCPDHALQAVRTAQAMQRKTAELRKEWENTGGMPIEIRIGIHTGEMVVGNMGSSARMDYTVIGSNVNLAQRLESSCPPGGILISEQVFRQLNDAVAAQAAGTIQAKGFSEPVSVYTVDIESTTKS